MSEEGTDGGDERVGPRSRPQPPDFVVERLLEHPLRALILELVEQRPGSNKNQLAEELDIHTNLLEHHLEKLENAGVLVTRPAAQGREFLVFSADDADLWENERTRILFGRSQNRNVALYLAENPGATSRQIAEALDLSPVTVRHHLRTLKEHGLVDGHPTGRTHLYEPHDELQSWAEGVGRAFRRPWEE